MATPLTRATIYQVHEAVGRGGMASVHLATMTGPAGARRVAIKKLAGERAVDEEARALLIEEGRLVFQLTHANICQVFDLAAGDDGAFLVMEYIDGLDLRRLIQKGGPLEIPHALYVAREVARALDYAHRRRDASGQPLTLVHGDVTPANVLLSCEGEVKLADFGIASALAGTSPGAQLIGGTPGYVAPETAGHGPSQRGDLYSLGATLHAALTGKPPEPRGALAPLRAARPDVSPELEGLVARAAAADPEARYSSAAQLEEGLALELARRYSGFTPSSLARAVLRARGDAGGAAAEEATTRVVLRSMTAATSAEVPSLHAKAYGTETAPPAPARRRGLAIGALLVALAAAAATAIVWSSRPREEGAPAAAGLAPPDAGSVPPVAAVPPPDASPAPPPADAPRPRPRGSGATARTSAPARNAAAGSLTVTAGTWGAVYVDGRKVAAQTPLYRFKLPAGRHRVKLFHPNPGRYSTTRVVTVAADRDATVTFP